MSNNKNYEYQPPHLLSDPISAIRILKQRISNPIVAGAVPATDPVVLQTITADFLAQAIQLQELRIPPEDYDMYMKQVSYHAKHPNYYSFNLAEKSFEHFAALQLLGVNNSDVFIDLASEGSPLPEIVARLFQAEAFAQDIMYEPGLHGNRIGGDACDLPLPDAFASKAALTCSLEHFEGSSDIELFRELGRVLKPGGKVCVIPLYLYGVPVTQTDARYSAVCDVRFDSDCTVFCADGWGNRHGRFYTVSTLRNRILDRYTRSFSFSIYRIVEVDSIASGIYARWALVAEKI